jgi:hypothetical protein
LLLLSILLEFSEFVNTLSQISSSLITHLRVRNVIWQTSTWRPTSAFDARSRILVHIISHILPKVVGCPQCFNHIPEEMVLPGMGLSSSAHIIDWKFALLPAGMRVSCGWQPLFEYLFCCKQRPSKFRKTGFFKSVKATSCLSNAASNTSQLDSKLQAMPHYSVLSSQWILNWTIWYTCSPDAWTKNDRHWSCEYRLIRKNQHICVLSQY